MAVDTRYVDGSYLAANPNWDAEDAAWKASKVVAILADNKVQPATLCDVGCGSGDVLANLQRSLPTTRFAGFDVSPQLAKFWARHPTIDFRTDFFDNQEVFDVLTMLDVFEHVRDPFTFLEGARKHARQFVFHIPLDLCAMNVARAAPLMTSRRQVGHLHFYTKDLALETLTDCGFHIVDWSYTDSYTLTTHHTWKTRVAAIPRRIAYAVNKDFGVRLLGGETLIVLAN
jgi:SAM-dependent methyltransferase